MFLALLLLILTTAGGGAITYLYDDDAPLIARCAAGTIIGSACFGLLGFLLAFGFGLNIISVVVAALISAAPLVIFRREDFRQRWQNDLNSAIRQGLEFSDKLNFSRIAIVILYAGLFVLLWFFFDRAMLDIRGGGIGTGAINNIGDLPFHLTVINSFVAGQTFPPQNPIYAGVTFTYPFMTDLVAAMSIVAGADARSAMFLQNIALATALVVLLARFTFKLTNNTTAALIAPFLLFFNGGFGFLLFLSDAITSEAGILGQLFNLTNDYTIRSGTAWRWGNSLTILFTTQRSILFGIPLALIVLTKIWEIFSQPPAPVNNLTENHDAESVKKNLSWISWLIPKTDYLPVFIVGLLAGMLLLIHAHSFAVVMGMTALLAIVSFRQSDKWAVFFAAASLVAIPELLLVMSGSGTSAQSFIGWEFGWDGGQTNPLWFWFKNTGLFIPLLAVAVGWLVRLCFKRSGQEPVEPAATDSLGDFFDARRARTLLLFCAPFALCFVVPNLLRLAPWVWDNIKVLIYWYLLSIPLVALVLARLWQRANAGRYLSLGLIITLTLAGSLDVWRVASRQYEYQIMPAAALEIAAQIRQRTAPRALIMSAPTYDSAIGLTGRPWFLGYTGHVWSHGINASERESVIRQIYAAEDPEIFIEEYNIDYVLISPLERKFTEVNETFFQKYPVVAESGEYKLYRTR